MESAIHNPQSAIESGWARVPPYLVVHYWPVPQAGNHSVRVAFCGAAAGLIAPEQFTPREQLSAEDVCARCLSLSMAAAAGLTELARRLEHGERARCFVMTACLLLCCWLSGCREPQLAPAPAARNLSTPTPCPTRELSPKVREKLEQGLLHELPTEALRELLPPSPCPQPGGAQ